MNTKRCRVGRISKLTGLKSGVINRLADKGLVPSFRPAADGNRYFEPDKVMASLGLAMPGADTQEGGRNE